MGWLGRLPMGSTYCPLDVTIPEFGMWTTPWSSFPVETGVRTSHRSEPVSWMADMSVVWWWWWGGGRGVNQSVPHFHNPKIYLCILDSICLGKEHPRWVCCPLNRYYLHDTSESQHLSRSIKEKCMDNNKKQPLGRCKQQHKQRVDNRLRTGWEHGVGDG